MLLNVDVLATLSALETDETLLGKVAKEELSFWLQLTIEVNVLNCSKTSFFNS